MSGFHILWCTTNKTNEHAKPLNKNRHEKAQSLSFTILLRQMIHPHCIIENYCVLETCNQRCFNIVDSLSNVQQQFTLPDNSANDWFSTLRKSILLCKSCTSMSHIQHEKELALNFLQRSCKKMSAHGIFFLDRNNLTSFRGLSNVQCALGFSSGHNLSIKCCSPNSYPISLCLLHAHEPFICKNKNRPRFSTVEKWSDVLAKAGKRAGKFVDDDFEGG